MGKIVMRAAAEHPYPPTRTGGQNPAFVDETANLKDAARKLSELRHGRAMEYLTWLRVRSRVVCGRVRGRV